MTQAIDVRSTSEYKTSIWIGQNLQDRRVFVPGSDYLWLNAFSDTPQLEGGFDQGVTNPLVQDVHYQMYMGEASPNGGELSILWLKVFGVHAVTVSGPRSTEVYKPFRNWKKFEGLLPVLWRDGDDIIYRVLPDSVSLAHVLPSAGRVTRLPASVLDADFLRAYVAPLENPALPPVEMAWKNRHHAVLATDLEKDQLLLVQITYHPGWHARVSGAVRHITKDPIGLLLIEPACQGRCVVDVEYGDDAEMLIARTVSWAAIAGAILWVVVSLVRKRYWRSPIVAEHR